MDLHGVVIEIFDNVFLIKQSLVIGSFYDSDCPQPQTNPINFYNWFSNKVRTNSLIEFNHAITFSLTVSKQGHYCIDGYMYGTNYGNIFIRGYAGATINVTENNGTVTAKTIHQS